MSQSRTLWFSTPPKTNVLSMMSGRQSAELSEVWEKGENRG